MIFSASATLTGGTAETAEFALELGKPLLHLVCSAGVEVAAMRLQAFLRDHRITVLNVAGPRASQESQTGLFVQAVLTRAHLGIVITGPVK